MTRSDRFERDLPDALRGLYLGPTPSYRDDILGRTAAIRQRPGWTFIERWLPMSAISERLTAAPRVPWRMAIAVVLIILALAISAVLIAGAQRNKLPAPFGLAGNGKVVYNDYAGDVSVVDPATGSTTTISNDPSIEVDATFSPDGTHIAFFRRVDAATESYDIVVTAADGSTPVVITPRPLQNWRGWYEWAPDGRTIIAIRSQGRGIHAYDTTRAAEPRVLADDFIVDTPSFRPPDGAQILFQGTSTDGVGLYTVNADGSRVRAVIEPRQGGDPFDYSPALWSPDGTRIAFQVAAPPNGTQVKVMNADGTGVHEIPNPGWGWAQFPLWSPDGTRIAFLRWPLVDPGRDYSPLAIAQADGSSVTEIGPPYRDGGTQSWSPDGKSLLYRVDSYTYVIDANTGTWTKVDWGPAYHQSDDYSGLSWQRVSP